MRAPVHLRSERPMPDSLEMQTTLPPLQSYDIAALNSDGTPFSATYRAPTYPQIDAAFSAFARGALLSSPQGPIAIEDLQPGDRLQTSGNRPATVRWIGSSVYAPGDPDRQKPLIRIMGDSFGPGRPAACVTVGPAARLLHTPGHLRGTGGPVLTPARDLVDSLNVIELTPPTPVRLFHIGLCRHAIVQVDGIEMESFHPGPHITRQLSHSMRTHFLAMFPHVDRFSDFGPLAYPRAADYDNDQAA